MYQLAIYGKGGIGKSTMAANISVALAKKGQKVLQVGCDPKHDSTRLLLDGKTQPTVLEYIRNTPVMKRNLSDVIVTGSEGILCAEAGGPEPGIGCAGRGILTTFDTLKKLGADKLDVDVKIYDVLGDVVCGGFAVPLRGEYADGIVLVTSGEFMAMYAANNIMKGIGNFDTGSPRLIGIVLNSRGVDGEEETVRKFAAAAGTEVIAVIPKDNVFAEAESRGHTVRELFPDSEISKQIDALAQRITDVAEGRCQCTYPHPLDDDQMSDLAAGRDIRPGGPSEPQRDACGACTGCGRTSIKDSRIMMSCAAYGAYSVYTQMADFAVILHGPESCKYFMDTSRGKALIPLYDRNIFDHLPANNVRCTMMDDSVSIFGGIKHLESALRSTIAEGFERIAVITTCMPGIIGDDCVGLIDKMRKENPKIDIHYVPADGDITGDYNEGFMMAAARLFKLADTGIKPKKGLINLIGTGYLCVHTRHEKAELKTILGRFGLSVNCRFLDESVSKDIVNFCRGSVDMLVDDTPSNKRLYGIVSRSTGRELFPVGLPTGLHDYREWVDKVGKYMGMEEEARAEIQRVQDQYDGFVSEHRCHFEGKRVFIVVRMIANVDWLIDLLLDLRADLIKVASQINTRMTGGQSSSRHSDRIETNYDPRKLKDDLMTGRPDLVIADTSSSMGPLRLAKVSKIGIGITSSLEYIEYLEDIMRLPIKEGWREVNIS